MHPQPTSIYAYQRADGSVVHEVLRYEPKDFRQRVHLGDGNYRWKLDGIERVPYRLPALQRGIALGEIIFFVEGEKDVDRLADLGMYATTNAGGASWKLTPEFIGFFRSAKRIVIIPDCDEPGRNAARVRAELLTSVCSDVRLVDLGTDKPEKYDISDWFDAGHTVEELQSLAESAPVVSVAENSDVGNPQWVSLRQVPVLENKAFYGPLGAIIRELAPHTEASAAGMLFQLIAIFATAIGRKAFVRVGAVEHRAILFVAIIGRTSRARKGQSWAEVYKVGRLGLLF